ncbi:MAG: cytochrome C oxidase subunit IV family protein [Gemmataceae bacterium]
MSTHHVTTVRTYTTIFVILVGLTVLTAVTAVQPLGQWHTPVALGIAFAKAALVFLFFMHLLHSPKLIWLVAGGTLVWLVILFVLTWADYYARGIIEFR